MLAMQSRLKNGLKKFFKQNTWILSILTNLLFYYIKLVYKTSQWNIVNNAILKSQATIFLLWHEQLVFGPGIFKNHSNVHALVSPHRDGKIIADIISRFGFSVIEGSSNREAFLSLKSILATIKANGKIVITPDGPRGPAKKINSNIAKIVQKYNINLYTISVLPSKYFRLKSWDSMIIPYPFCYIKVVISAKIILGKDTLEHLTILEDYLNSPKDYIK